jgi:hypothetical protein
MAKSGEQRIRPQRAAKTPPVYRYLRGYCLDPGFSTRLDTAGINEAVYRIPFEKVAPGPAGEYIDVVDFDPASNAWYAVCSRRWSAPIRSI